jgi:hypothetical protein
MELDELKIRLKISDTSQDESLLVALDDALSYAKSYCHNQFTDGIPPAVKKGIALLVKSMNENSNVSSQSLGDMSKAFFEGATLREAHVYFKPYRKPKFV